MKTMKMNENGFLRFICQELDSIVISFIVLEEDQRSFPNAWKKMNRTIVKRAMQSKIHYEKMDVHDHFLKAVIVSIRYDFPEFCIWTDCYDNSDSVRFSSFFSRNLEGSKRTFEKMEKALQS